MSKQGKTERTLSQAITVQELIDSLMEIEDKERPVVFTYNYGDHWNTPVCEPVTEVLELKVEYSDYHNRLKLEKEIDEDDDFKGKDSNAVVLNNGNIR